MPNEFEFIYNKIFDDKTAEKHIMGPMPNAEAHREKVNNAKIPSNVRVELREAHRYPLLAKAQEQHLFRKMNYIKYNANKALKAKKSAKFKNLSIQAFEIEELLIVSNLRLVISVAKRYKRDYDLAALLSDGSLAIINSVRKFDYSLNFKFSTYASWALWRQFSREMKNESTEWQNVKTNMEFYGATSYQEDGYNNDSMAIAKLLLSKLDDRSALVLNYRMGLDCPPAPDNSGRSHWALDEIGKLIGISKERVRQLEARAILSLKNKYIDAVDGVLIKNTDSVVRSDCGKYIKFKKPTNKPRRTKNTRQPIVNPQVGASIFRRTLIAKTID